MLRFPKILAYKICLILLLLLSPGLAGATYIDAEADLAISSPPELLIDNQPTLPINALAAIVIDADSGRILWQKNAQEALPPASTGKILTALTAIDMADYQQNCQISAAAAAVGESSINLVAGENLSLDDLLQGALIQSGNDACHAIAENLAGSEPFFIYWLNLKAAAIGAYSTDFKNSNGLPAEGHQINAADLALISRHLLANDYLAQIVATKETQIGSGSSSRQLKNTNKLLWQEDIIGLKTGTTNAAGSCLIAAMERDGRILISVVLNSPNRYDESLTLLEFGFSNYLQLNLYKQDQIMANIPLKDGSSLNLVAASDFSLSYNQDDLLIYDWQLPSDLAAPIAKNQHIGSLKILNQQGLELASLSLLAANDIAADELSFSRQLLFKIEAGLAKIKNILSWPFDIKKGISQIMPKG